jgi:methyltransferase
VVTLWAYTGFIGLLALERLYELRLSQRNAARAFARGALEVGLRHYRVMTVFHAAFLVSCVAEPWLLQREFPGVPGLVALILALLAQALRYWAISTLGEKWNTRVIVMPGTPPITTGPYRFIKHPNYVAVVVELVAVPLIFGGWITAAVFSIGNAALLAVRIRAEERALGQPWQQAFAGKGRFIPGGKGG